MSESHTKFPRPENPTPPKEAWQVVIGNKQLRGIIAHFILGSLARPAVEPQDIVEFTRRYLAWSDFEGEVPKFLDSIEENNDKAKRLEYAGKIEELRGLLYPKNS